MTLSRPTLSLFAFAALILMGIGIVLLMHFNAEVSSTKEFDPKAVLAKVNPHDEINDYLEIENLIGETMKTYGTKAGFEVIDEGERQQMISNDGCHSLLHYVGHVAFNENPTDYDALLDIVEGTTCIGGYIHGLEAEIVLTSSNVIKDLQNFCVFEKEKGVGAGACYHGAGHAAAELYTYDVPKALALCDALLGEPEHDLNNCYRGVFSEISNVVEGYDGHTGLFGDKVAIPGLDPDEPYRYCEGFDEKYQSSCKSQLTRLFSMKNMDDWVESCNAVQDEESKNICLNISAGMYVRDKLSFTETTELPSAFNDLLLPQQKATILGAAESFAGYFQEQNMKDWETFCNTIKNPDALSYCTEVFDLLLRDIKMPWDIFREFNAEA